MNPTIEELTSEVEQKAKRWPEVLRLMTHPGVRPITAMAFVLIIGRPERFHCGKQIGSYVGLIPSEDSSAGHQRLGYITKQGSSVLRFLLAEAAQAAARCDVDLETTVHAPGAASAKEHCQGGHGSKTGGAVVLDVAERLGVCAVGEECRFEEVSARGPSTAPCGRASRLARSACGTGSLQNGRRMRERTGMPGSYASPAIGRTP